MVEHNPSSDALATLTEALRQQQVSQRRRLRYPWRRRDTVRGVPLFVRRLKAHPLVAYSLLVDSRGWVFWIPDVEFRNCYRRRTC